ncbi:MAG: phosphate-starvation-inducible PsiE family protein [Marinilabiliales bacterium]|nr:phosphate-starvation-inducible PsiE family protein [Marinilabiliales bacterium]
MTMIEIVNKFEKVSLCSAHGPADGGTCCGSVIDLVIAPVYSPWVELLPVSAGNSRELIAILGAFLLVLIGVELLDTIKAYFKENSIHVEIVVLLAVIAVARKVILLDPYRHEQFGVRG